MKNVDLQLICYLEGIKIPIKRVSTVSQQNLPSICTFSLPTVDEIAKIEVGTQVQIFYYDSYTEVYRLLYDGEISRHIYKKMGGQKERGLAAVGLRKYLNELPTKYVAALESSIPKNSAMVWSDDFKFYNIPVEIDNKLKMLGDLKEKFIILQLSEQRKKAELGLVKYFQKFLNLFADSWEKFYKNTNTRLKIKKNHVFIDEALFQRWYNAEACDNFLTDRNRNVFLGRNDTILDAMLQEFMTIGYSYCSIPTPAYNTNAFKGKSAIDKDVSINREGNAIAQYILLPYLLNAIPPRCNIIMSGGDSSLHADIWPPKITRLKYKYKIYDGGNDPNADWTNKVQYYPKDLPNNKFKMTKTEYSYGIRAQVINKRSDFNAYIATATNRDGEEKFYENAIKYDYQLEQYRNNKVQMVTSEFLPYIISGLPGIIYDTTANIIYYGIVDSVGLEIDQDKGRAGTTVNLIYAREINSLDDIGPISAFLAPEAFNAKNIDDTCYAHFLKGSNMIAKELPEDTYPIIKVTIKGQEEITGEVKKYNLQIKRKNAQYNGWQSIASGATGFKNLQSELEKSKDLYNRREIVTFGEYFTMKGIYEEVTDKKDIYERKYMLPVEDVCPTASDETKHIISLKENAGVNEYIANDKQVFIKDRRKKVRDLKDKYGQKILG